MISADSGEGGSDGGYALTIHFKMRNELFKSSGPSVSTLSPPPFLFPAGIMGY